MFHERLFEDEIVAVTAHDDPLTAFRTVSIEQLARRRLFLESKSSPNCQRLIERFESKNLEPIVELYCANNTLSIGMALAAREVALVPKIALKSVGGALGYRRIDDGVTRSLAFCCPGYISDDPAVAAFRNAVRECFKQL